MEDILTHFKDKKNVITYLILAILVLAIPLTVRLVQTQQKFISKAAGGDITCPGLTMQGTTCVTKEVNVELKLDSPYGSPKP